MKKTNESNKSNDDLNSLKEIQLSTQSVFSGSFLKVFQDKIQTSSGHQSVREFIHHPGASLVVPVLPNGNLLAIRQFRYPLQRIFIEFPAGKMDPGETPEQTAIRELEEEVSHTSKNLKKLTEIHPAIGYADEVIHLFTANNLIKIKASKDVDESIESIEISVDKLKKMIWNHEITDVKTQIAAFWYFRSIEQTFSSP